MAAGPLVSMELLGVDKVHHFDLASGLLPHCASSVHSSVTSHHASLAHVMEWDAL